MKKNKSLDHRYYSGKVYLGPTYPIILYDLQKRFSPSYLAKFPKLKLCIM